MLLKVDHSSSGIATLSLNRPESYNALSQDLMRALIKELNSIATNKDVRVVVLRGEGKGFSAGHDLKEISAQPDRAFYQSLMQDCCMLMETIQSIPQPVIAQVHGVATAAGCQLVAACDMAIAASSSRFATPGVLIGLFCTTPMVEVSRNMLRKKAFELLFTGDLVDAQSALSMGLINRVVEAEQLEASVIELAEKIASKSSYVVSLGKKAFYKQLELNKHEAYGYAADIMVQNLLAHDAVEGISAFLEKRKPNWKRE